MSQNTTEYSIHNLHDVSYKQLFFNRKLFYELLQSFINAEWVKQIDETSLIRMGSAYSKEDFRLTEADLVYQVALDDHDIYIYVLTELQASVDFKMPYRLLKYMMGVWNDIEINAETESSRKSFRFPLIIPIILYNGAPKWTAAPNFNQLLQSFEVAPEIISTSYYLIDVNRYSREELKKMGNQISAIFLLDQKYDIMEFPERFEDILPTIQKFTAHEYDTFIKWFGFNLCSRMRIPNVDELVTILLNSSPKEAETVYSNLAENVRRWHEDAKREGKLEGRQEGIQEGKQKGRQEGRQEGILEGKKEGIIEGRLEERISIAKNMIDRQLPVEAIVDITKLSLKEVLDLYKEAKHT